MRGFRTCQGDSTAGGRAVFMLYPACTVLVFSFILFEVLDLDASDFPAPTKTTSIKLVEPPHDLKRAATSPVEGPTMPSPGTPSSERIQSPVFLESPVA